MPYRCWNPICRLCYPLGFPPVPAAGPEFENRAHQMRPARIEEYRIDEAREFPPPEPPRVVVRPVDTAGFRWPECEPEFENRAHRIPSAHVQEAVTIRRHVDAEHDAVITEVRRDTDGFLLEHRIEPAGSYGYYFGAPSPEQLAEKHVAEERAETLASRLLPADVFERLSCGEAVEIPARVPELAVAHWVARGTSFVIDDNDVVPFHGPERSARIFMTGTSWTIEVQGYGRFKTCLIFGRQALVPLWDRITTLYLVLTHHQRWALQTAVVSLAQECDDWPV